MSVTRVLVIAQNRLYREGIAGAFASVASVQVRALAPTTELMTEVTEARADVILADCARPGSGSVIRALRSAAAGARVVALGVSGASDDVVALVEAGIAGYVTFNDSLETMVRTTLTVAEGQMPCSPEVAAGLVRRLSALAEGHARPSALDGLTPRELEVLGLIDDGMTNKQIAGRLSIEVPTVKNHVRSILEKLHVDRRGAAAAVMRRSASGR